MTLASEQSAARFLALRAHQRRRGRARDRATVQREREIVQRMRDGRIVVDFAPATLRAIHLALCDALGDALYVGNTLHAIMVGEQMIAVALGIPPADDPPLTDRNSR